MSIGMSLSLVEDTQAPPETWPQWVTIDQWAHYKSIDTSLELLKQSKLTYTEPGPSSSKTDDSDEDEYEDDEDDEEDELADGSASGSEDEGERDDASSDSGDDEAGHELAQDAPILISATTGAPPEEPEEEFVAGWCTASESDSEESDSEDEDAEIVYLGRRPAPCTQSVAVDEEDELDIPDFEAHFLREEPAEAPAAPEPPKPAKPPLTPYQRLRLKIARSAAVRPRSSDVESDDEALETLVNITNVVSATAAHGDVLTHEEDSGSDDDAQVGNANVAPNTARSAPTGIDPLATIGLPSPSSPVNFGTQFATASPQSSPVATQKSRGTKRRQPTETESEEDSAADEDYVPSRKASATRKRKPAQTRNGGRPRKVKRQCVKAEDTEDDMPSDTGSPEGLNTVICRWQNCGATVERLRIWNHVEAHLAIPRGEKGGEKQCRVQCLWVGCNVKKGPHSMNYESLRKHIHSAASTGYLCPYYCRATERMREYRRKVVEAKRAGKTQKLTKPKEKAGEPKIWGPCLHVYSQLWRLNDHIEQLHPGKQDRLTSNTAMLLD